MTQGDREIVERIYSANISIWGRVMNSFLPGKHFHFIFDTNTLNYVWISDAIKNVLGYNLNNLDILKQSWIIHPEDEPICRLIDKKIRLMVNTNNRDWLSPYNIVIDFRCLHAEGYYVHLLCQMVQLKQELPDSNLFYGSMTDISHTKKNGKPTFSLVSIDGSEPTIEIQLSDSPVGFNPFTLREKEIVTLVMQGLSAKEIAQRLFISLYTVKNHKKNIFAKVGCNSCVQLFQKCIAYGWTEN